MAHIIYDDLRFCTTCMLLAVNGEAGDISDEEEAATDAGLKALSKHGYIVANFDSEIDTGYEELSCQRCDCCNTKADGTRFKMALLSADDTDDPQCDTCGGAGFMADESEPCKNCCSGMQHKVSLAKRLCDLHKLLRQPKSPRLSHVYEHALLRAAAYVDETSDLPETEHFWYLDLERDLGRKPTHSEYLRWVKWFAAKSALYQLENSN